MLDDDGIVGSARQHAAHVGVLTHNLQPEKNIFFHEKTHHLTLVVRLITLDLVVCLYIIHILKRGAPANKISNMFVTMLNIYSKLLFKKIINCNEA